jgi:hypothetical protein
MKIETIIINDYETEYDYLEANNFKENNKKTNKENVYNNKNTDMDNIHNNYISHDYNSNKISSFRREKSREDAESEYSIAAENTNIAIDNTNLIINVPKNSDLIFDKFNRSNTKQDNFDSKEISKDYGLNNNNNNNSINNPESAIHSNKKHNFDEIPIKCSNTNFMELLEQRLNENPNLESNTIDGERKAAIVKERKQRRTVNTTKQNTKNKKYKYYSDNFDMSNGKDKENEENKAKKGETHSRNNNNSGNTSNIRNSNTNTRKSLGVKASNSDLNVSKTK